MRDTELLQKALESGNERLMNYAVQLLSHPLYAFTPRPDKPEALDQQSSFYLEKFPGMACVIAGNGAGKSYTASAKVAKFLEETPPPEPNTPYWILSQTMEMVGNCCWGQNLSHFIRPDIIAGITYYNKVKGIPKSVVLKPHANGSNYVIELKSYDMDRQALQAANIVGFWCDEQAPFEIIMECWARTRRWSYPGSKLYTMTPLEPDMKLEELFHEPPESWRFYRLNTRVAAAAGHVQADYVKQIEANEMSELVETRMTGAFARYEGAIYKSFDPAIHVVEPFELPKQWLRVRGLDLGWNHYTACVWAARDLNGRYYIYREYFAAKTSIEDHVREINDGWEKNLVKGHTYADPAAAQMLHEFFLRGLHTVQAQKDVPSGIACVQSLLRPGVDGKPMLQFFSTCPMLISQMRSYVYDPKTGKPKKENSTYLMDGADALRYLVFSHTMDSMVTTSPLKLPEKRNILKYGLT